MMNLSEICGWVAGASFVIAFVILIAVGYVHGAKFRMLPWDPALKNEISTTGKKFILVAGGLIVLAIILAYLSILIMHHK